MPSLEFRNLKALDGEPREPMQTRTGDLWHLTGKENGLSYTMLVMEHKKHGRRRYDGHTYVFMYHWGHPSLLATPCTLRDNDGNALQAEASLTHHIQRGDRVRYIGNIFEMLPLSELVS